MWIIDWCIWGGIVEYWIWIWEYYIDYPLDCGWIEWWFNVEVLCYQLHNYLGIIGGGYTEDNCWVGEPIIGIF